MTGEDPEGGRPPDVVVVGAASRDVAADDPRGWRLGGGVAYSALAVARLGLRTAALIGTDEAASRAKELDLLREAGVDVRIAVIDRGPVFENIERPGGRLQLCHSPSDLLPATALPPAWRSARSWILAPVAAELTDDWAGVPDPAAHVTLGWQGLLRLLVAGAPVAHLLPAPSGILRRADLVGVSRDDVDGRIELAALCRLLRNGATLVLTQGLHGGVVIEVGDGYAARMRRYPAVPSATTIDPTGAGDVFLAALAAVRVEPGLVARATGRGLDLLLAAAAASLVLERRGLLGVPDHAAVRARMTGAQRR